MLLNLREKKNQQYRFSQTWVTPTLTSLLTDPPTLSISPPLFRKPDPPRRNPVAMSSKTSSRVALFTFCRITFAKKKSKHLILKFWATQVIISKIRIINSELSWHTDPGYISVNCFVLHLQNKLFFPNDFWPFPLFFLHGYKRESECSTSF